MSTPAEHARALREPQEAASADAAEARWVARAKAGERRAFGRLYRRYERLVHGILLSRVPPAEVPDLVQDVFTRALGRLDGFEDGAPFGPWIAALARHRAIDHLRTRRHMEPWSEPLRSTPAVAPQALEALRMILALPEVYRETMVLRLVEGMTGPQIAARTGLTAGSVRVKLHRGMKLLRDQLREDDS